MPDIEKYIADPCRSASIPYWKAVTLNIPEGLQIVHDDDFTPSLHPDYSDEPYFRIKHDLRQLPQPVLPAGFAVQEVGPHTYAEHINSCYPNICITVAELLAYTLRPVYSPELWLAVQDSSTGKTVATGIAELDRSIGEGILEWIQVSPEYRSRGLGRFLVLELLRRMKPMADFATVSGQCNNPTSPERLYRNCGFTGTDVWHILRRKNND